MPDCLGSTTRGGLSRRTFGSKSGDSTLGSHASVLASPVLNAAVHAGLLIIPTNNLKPTLPPCSSRRSWLSASLGADARGMAPGPTARKRTPLSSVITAAHHDAALARRDTGSFSKASKSTGVPRPYMPSYSRPTLNNTTRLPSASNTLYVGAT